MTIIEALHDSRFFLPVFKDIRTWHAWEIFLKALFALPIEGEEDKRLFREATGLTEPPSSPSKESFVLCGRRSGKSRISSILASYVSCFRDWSKVLSPGEVGWVFIIATDKAQAAIIKRYVRAILDGSPSFRKLVKGETQETIELKNGVNIGIKTSSFRSVRGYTILCAILEELAFWRSEDSANPDRETLAALRPALATVPGSLLLGISTVYSRSGVLYDSWKTHYGQPGPTLIWRSESTRMNPTLDRAMIERELEADSEAASAEWLSIWRSDISSFIPFELIEAVTIPGRFELPKVEGISYVGFCDPSGGRGDSFCLGISHKESNGKIILDVVEERRPPFSPESVVEEYADVLKNFGLSQVHGDSYSASWCSDSFRKNGVFYMPSEKSASELYTSFLPLLTSGKVELLDSKRLRGQLIGLERRVRAGGKDLVIHGPGLHDDLSNTVAGVCVLAASEPQRDGLPVVMPNKSALTMEDLEKRKETCWLLDRKWEPTTEEKELLAEEELEKKLLEELEEESGKGS